MNQDQKPARVRAVSGGSATADAAADETAVVEDSTPAPTSSTAPNSASGKIIFLLGCALGGGAIAALPHVLSVPR